MIHLLHREWQITYCGRNIREHAMTSTVSLMTCPGCLENLRLIARLQEATPNQFEESK